MKSKTATADEEFLCPYCHRTLEPWEPHPHAGWSHDLFFCGNDSCAYFVEGRRKICTEFEKNFAYRYCLDPVTRKALPIVTWCGGHLSLLKGRVESSE